MPFSSQFRTATNRWDRKSSLPRTHAISGWRMLRRLNEGASREIWLAAPLSSANHSQITTYVLKLATVGQGDLGRAMLAREAEVSSLVTHPHLISVLDDNHQAPQPFLVLPRLQGVSLRHFFGRSILPKHWVSLLRQAAEALLALHNGGWVHGDVKPAHLFVSPQGQLTLLDLGLARRLESLECDAGAYLLGAAEYLAPELLSSGGRYSPASDIFALAQVFCRLASPSVELNSRERVLGGRLLESSGPRLRSTIPGPLARLLGRMLLQDPLRRPSAEELVDLLLRCELDLLGR
jgi:serine/threonine protein kinase